MKRIFLPAALLALLLPLAQTASAEHSMAEIRPGGVSWQPADYSRQSYYRNGQRWSDSGTYRNRQPRWNNERRWDHDSRWRDERNRERERTWNQHRSEQRSWSAPRRNAERFMENNRGGHHGGGHHGGGHHGGGHHGHGGLKR